MRSVGFYIGALVLLCCFAGLRIFYQLPTMFCGNCHLPWQGPRLHSACFLQVVLFIFDVSVATGRKNDRSQTHEEKDASASGSFQEKGVVDVSAETQAESDGDGVDLAIGTLGGVMSGGGARRIAEAQRRAGERELERPAPAEPDARMKQEQRRRVWPVEETSRIHEPSRLRLAEQRGKLRSAEEASSSGDPKRVRPAELRGQVRIVEEPEVGDLDVQGNLHHIQ